MLIQKTRQFLKEIKDLLSADTHGCELPGTVFFMNNGDVLCLNRQKGESRFPYARDGYILWAHSTGHIHVKSGIFNVFKPVYDSNEINVEFFAGIQNEQGNYFPVSLLGGAKQANEPFHVKRYLVYTLSAGIVFRTPGPPHTPFDILAYLQDTVCKPGTRCSPWNSDPVPCHCIQEPGIGLKTPRLRLHYGRQG